MKTKLLLVALSLAASIVSANGPSDTKWTYSGAKGPAEWAKLTPESASCGGRNQSPINLTGFIKADLKPIKFAYQAGGN